MSTTPIFSLLSAFGGIVADSYWRELHGGGRQRREIEQCRKSERAASIGARAWRCDGTIVVEAP